MKTELEQLKEQLNSISEKIKQLETPSFQKGKWYIEKDYHFNKPYKCLVFFETELTGYGINRDGKWINTFRRDDHELFMPATDKEVEEALIKEAKKRGFKEGVKVERTNEMLKLHGTSSANEIVLIENNRFTYDKIENSLCIDGRVIFINGIWAEIIFDYSIGCKKVGVGGLLFLKAFMKNNKFETVSFDNNKITIKDINKILDL